MDKENGDIDLDDDDDTVDQQQQQPSRSHLRLRRCLRTFFTFVYVFLAFVAVLVTYSMIMDLVHSMNNPVRSIKYNKVEEYKAPGLAFYPGGAEFLACGHYYNNIVTSKVRLTDLDLLNQNCSFLDMHYEDPVWPGVKRDVLVVRGPTSFSKREAVFLHFALEDETRDFFTVSYFVFPNWDDFNQSSTNSRINTISNMHAVVPTFALSAGMRMWIKLRMTENNIKSTTDKHTEFSVEYSVVKFWDKRKAELRKKHLFFIFFEWKNDIVEESHLLYTTTPWSIGAGLCGVFLTLHRGYCLAQTSYKKMQKEKKRRETRKQTIKELRRQRTVELEPCNSITTEKEDGVLSS